MIMIYILWNKYVSINDIILLVLNSWKKDVFVRFKISTSVASGTMNTASSWKLYHSQVLLYPDIYTSVKCAWYINSVKVILIKEIYGLYVSRSSYIVHRYMWNLCGS